MSARAKALILIGTAAALIWLGWIVGDAVANMSQTIIENRTAAMGR